ncbi:unnamed protein product [Parnassius apollo]|uniref:Period circadian protein n=1 Tax=Parnassius apollo TaxID=110799 RepID=A0A8S3VZ84_PARAO|nr:unnamed protein product [Parnassius apollo]
MSETCLNILLKKLLWASFCVNYRYFIMDIMDDSENNAKVSDSAYSNSCSNSQSRRSSKSTHSGSNSSGSSGYGGKPNTSGYSNNVNQPPKKRLKGDAKKKKFVQTEIISTEVHKGVKTELLEPVPIFKSPREDANDVAPIPSQALASPEKDAEGMDIAAPENSSIKDDDVAFVGPAAVSPINVLSYYTSRPPPSCPNGFSCVISMHNGVVLYTTSSVTTTLGFPKDMWIGKTFIDFVHPRDRNAFASQITNSLALPKNENGTQEKVSPHENSVASMVCRIRRCEDLNLGFGIKSIVTFMPFLLKLSFKNVSNDEGVVTYLVIQATPFFSAFRTPNEVVSNPVPFIIRHAANGNLEYLDLESVPYLGYLPQDVTDKNALLLYHPNDLVYLRQVYGTIVKDGGSPRTKPYRMMAQNGDFIKLETEWSSFINPWSKKLEFVIGKHHVIEGPTNPDVLQSPEPKKGLKLSEEEKKAAQLLRESIIKVLNEVFTKPAETAKQRMSKRCQDLAYFMESLLKDKPKTDDVLFIDVQEPDHSVYERDSVMLGGISPNHEYYDSKSSTGTPVSYNQLNYNKNMQRYFESYPLYSFEDHNTAIGGNIRGLKDPKNISNDRNSPSARTCDSSDIDSNPLIMGGVSSLPPVGDYQTVRLTESLLSKHNTKMEKELAKMHRESRSSSKGEKDKASYENRRKNKEHLARCNASFQPTSAGINMSGSKSHGVKRGTKQSDHEPGLHKHHCSSPCQSRPTDPTSTPISQALPSLSTAIASSPCPSNPINNMNTFILGVGTPQQLSIVNPVAAMPGVISNIVCERFKIYE